MVNKKTLLKSTIFSVLLLGFFMLGNLVSASISAETSSPNFPNCTTKIFSSDGDKASFDPPNRHGIVGRTGSYEGYDDVYTLESANYLQCYCPTDRTTGVQSNWWNVEMDGLSRTEIDSYKAQGWYEVNGKEWGLEDDTYIVKNSEFSCSQVTPTVTPTLTPTVTPTLTPTPSPVPSVTITPTPGPESRCWDLEAQPSEGTAPLTVKFIGHADDPATGGKIKQYRFDFADASGGQPQVWYQTDPVAYHKYELSGEYEAKLRVQDNAGNWRESDDCKVKIKVNSQPQVLGASSPTQLPTTGMPVVLLGSILPMGYAGYKLYRRYKLV